jgi:hypothetical protein
MDSWLAIRPDTICLPGGTMMPRECRQLGRIVTSDLATTGTPKGPNLPDPRAATPMSDDSGYSTGFALVAESGIIQL